MTDDYEQEVNDIRAGDVVLVAAKVALVFTTHDGRTQVQIDTDGLDLLDADRVLVIGRDT